MSTRIIKMRRYPSKAQPGAGSLVRAVNPSRTDDLGTMIREGISILQAEIQNSEGLEAVGSAEAMSVNEAREAKAIGAALQIAAGSSQADRRTALTRLQSWLRKWTEATAEFSADSEAQDYRKRLHITLDH